MRSGRARILYLHEEGLYTVGTPITELRTRLNGRPILQLSCIPKVQTRSVMSLRPDILKDSFRTPI